MNGKLRIARIDPDLDALLRPHVPKALWSPGKLSLRVDWAIREYLRFNAAGGGERRGDPLMAAVESDPAEPVTT